MRGLRLVPVRVLILVVAALVLVLPVVAGAVRDAATGPRPAGAGSAVPPAGPGGLILPEKPIGHYTPGQTASGIGLADLCPHLSEAWDGARRSLTDAQKRRVKALYGIGQADPVAEWDHLIPRELGGADTLANIWPMTDRDADQRKDRLENELHRQVCAGRLDLAEAQQRARQFWVWWS